jgi:hypothetical protein
LGVSSLILIPPIDLPAAFLAFFWGVGLPIAFCYPARVFKALAMELAEGLLTDSSLEGQVESGMIEIGTSPSKPGMGEIMLSKGCIQTSKV